MARRSTYGRKREVSTSRYLWVIILLLAAWLLWSITSQKSPIMVIKDAYYSVLGKDSLKSKTPKEWSKSYDMLQIRKDSTELALQECITSSPYKLGKISIEDDFVNLRDAASLSSNIIQKIPNEAEVNILYFDTNEYIWDGKMGKWCKVQYADLEGWVWGNYIIPQ